MSRTSNKCETCKWVIIQKVNITGRQIICTNPAKDTSLKWACEYYEKGLGYVQN